MYLCVCIFVCVCVCVENFVAHVDVPQNTPILALDVDRATLIGAARLRPDAPDGRQRTAELGSSHSRSKGELKALEKWCHGVSVRVCPLVVLYSPRDDVVEIMVRSLH